MGLVLKASFFYFVEFGFIFTVVLLSLNVILSRRKKMLLATLLDFNNVLEFRSVHFAVMSTYWLKNFVGLKQSDFELLRVPNAGAEFCIHVTLRTVQTGAILGSVLGPVSALMFRDQRANAKSMRTAFVEGGTNGAIIGALIGPIVTYLSLRNMNSIQLYDKCYRLRFDNQQLWHDRTSVVSAAVGYLSSGSMGFVVGLDLSMILSSIMAGAWK